MRLKYDAARMKSDAGKRKLRIKHERCDANVRLKRERETPPSRICATLERGATRKLATP